MKNLTLHWLLDTMPLKEFVEQQSEKPFHLKRSADYYNRLLRIEDVDRIITTMAHKPFSMAKDGYIIPGRSFKEGDDKDRVVDFYNQGATVILDGLERSWAPLSELCILTQQGILNSKSVIANVYLTPPSSQAFKIHADWQDVFILQISGKKSWKIFNPSTRYPLNESHTKLADGFPGPKDKLLDIVLSAGDLLYVPRGFAHEVKTLSDHSLHITLTVYPFTWMDFYSKGLELMSNSVERLRRPLPPNFLMGKIDVTKTAIEIADGFKDKKLTELIRQELLTEKRKTSKSNFLGFFQSMSKRTRVNKQTVFSSNKLIPKFIKKSGSKSMLVITNKGEFAIENVNLEIDFIFANDRFTVTDLPGKLKTSERLHLMRSLIGEGLVFVQE